MPRFTSTIVSTRITKLLQLCPQLSLKRPFHPSKFKLYHSSNRQQRANLRFLSSTCVFIPAELEGFNGQKMCLMMGLLYFQKNGGGRIFWSIWMTQVSDWVANCKFCNKNSNGTTNYTKLPSSANVVYRFHLYLGMYLLELYRYLLKFYVNIYFRRQNSFELVNNATHPGLAWEEQRLQWANLPNLYLQLGKSRLSTLVVVTALGGYVAAAQTHGFDVLPMLALWAGVYATAFSANALNQCLEVPYDAQMKRTQQRVLPRGAMSTTHAAIFGVLSGAAGILYCRKLPYLVAKTSKKFLQASPPSISARVLWRPCWAWVTSSSTPPSTPRWSATVSTTRGWAPWSVPCPRWWAGRPAAQGR